MSECAENTSNLFYQIFTIGLNLLCMPEITEALYFNVFIYFFKSLCTITKRALTIIDIKIKHCDASESRAQIYISFEN